MKDIIENKAPASRWIPLPLDYVLEKYTLISMKVLVLLFLWIIAIGVSVTSVLWISPSEFMLFDSSQAINTFFLFYPPLILGTLLLFWIGFEWGFIPLFLSGFIITFTASVTYYWGLLFGIAFVLGLGIYALAYYCAPFDPGLRDFKSFVFFTVVSFFAAIASSLGSFVWSDFFELSPFETILLWKGWWTGMFLQSMLIVGPILYLFTPLISSVRSRVFPKTPKPNVTLGWIYSAIGSVAIVLVLFIIGAKVLGTEGLNQQLAALDPSISRNLIQTNESLELISWISIGLVLSLGSGSIYLVGSWNKNLKQQVTLKTEQLTESQKRLKKALNEQDLLLNMIHDRVRDNLTIVLALLELQLKNEIEKPTSELLKDSHARIRSMALIHETMVQSESISEVNMKNFAIKLSNRLQKSFQNSQQNLEVSMNADEVLMHIDRAVPAAMILNELMVNAFAHGFADLVSGLIFVHFRKKGNNLYFKIRNNGHPLPSNFEAITRRTLGYKLIKTLIKQLNGELKIVDYKEPTIEVVVPLK
jgi:two-component sensor histidine kinase